MIRKVILVNLHFLNDYFISIRIVLEESVMELLFRLDQVLLILVKKLYGIDFAQAKSKDDRQKDLLSVLEDLKTGLVPNVLYGS